MQITINGREQTFGDAAPMPLAEILHSLNLRGDRIAVEHNGEIVPRSTWPETAVSDHDRLEIVHFVGGGGSFSINRFRGETSSNC